MKPVPYCVVALALAFPAVLVGLELPTWFSLGSSSLALQSDLRVFYTPGYMLRTGQRKEIYDFAAIRRNQDQIVAADGGAVPFLHPAYEVIVFAPLSFLPYRRAYLVWGLTNLALLALVWVMLRPCIPVLSSLGPGWIVPGTLLGFMPLAFTIFAGQDSLLLLLVLVSAYRRIESSELQAGILFGLGMFRFQVLLPIAVLLLLWRGSKFVAGCIFGTSVIVAISFAITGIGAQKQYFGLVRQMGDASFWLLLRRMPNLRGLFAACGLGTVPLVVASLCIFLLVAFVGTGRKPREKFLLAVSASALLTYYLFLHDACVLALPLLVVINDAISHRKWWQVAIAAAALSAFSSLWFLHDRFYLGALPTALLLGTQVAGVWPQSKLGRASPQAKLEML